MPNAVFDGLPDVFVETLGEPVTYTPEGGSPVLIEAIWTERPLDVIVGGEVSVDEIRSTLKVRASDLTPEEGATARRESDGRTMVVCTPIHPDGKGMIVCNLSA